MSNRKKGWVIAALLIGVAMAINGMPVSNAADGSAPSEHPSLSEWTPVAGRVTMIDLGADKCVPCKMMAPIIEELKKEYDGKADIVFIDVWKNPDQAKKYALRAIPTQIFFDAEGKEVSRHVGYMDKKSIIEILTKLGVS